MGFDLFQRGPVQQSNADLSERWNQDMSNLVNVADSSVADTGETLYTVTSGRTLFVTTMILVGNINATGVSLTDGSGGTLKFRILLAAGSPSLTFEFQTPLQFSSSVFRASGDAENVGITLTGWEE